MNEASIDTRDAAVRDALIGYVAAHQTRRRRGLWVAGLLVAGALFGAGASTAAFAVSGGFTTATPSAPAGGVSPALGEVVAAPPGTTPGEPIVSALGPPITQTVTQPTQLELTDRPDAATHVRITVTPVSAGSLSWGTDAAGNNPSASWGAADIAAATASTASTWSDVPLDESTRTLYLRPTGGLSATVSLQYLVYVPTHLDVNAGGDTYGLEGGPDGVPDLVLVVADTPDGGLAEGYARATDLNAFSPDHPGEPSTPEEALAWQAERDEAYPDGWDIPVFESDGVTQIGTFHIGG